MTDNEQKDVNFGLLCMVLTLSNRVEKLEKEVYKDKPAAAQAESDAVKCAKFHENNCKGWNGEEVNLRESVEKFQKEMDKNLKENEAKRLADFDEKRDAEIKQLKVEIQKLEAQTGAQENINRVIPLPVPSPWYPDCGCAHTWWR